MSLRLELDREAFLARYWQQEALFLPNALDRFTPPLTANEVAGLAMEEAIESRIVEQRGGEWQLTHGPFTAQELQREGSWSLLVQAVDCFIPEIAHLQRLIDFVPDWRLDDIMISVGSDGASVGPHYDNYDVFLLQAEGQKHWQIGQTCTTETPLLDCGELRILDSFEQQAEYLLNPGDILYVPPGTAHWGTAVGESTTYSIGFRAPRLLDLSSRWLDDRLDDLDSEQFFTDPKRSTPLLAGEITQADLAHARAQLLALLTTNDNSADWFGEVVTEPREDLHPTEEDQSRWLAALQQPDTVVQRKLGAKIAWNQTGEALRVYCNGQSASFEAALREQQQALCANGRLGGIALKSALQSETGHQWLQFLFESGGVDVCEG